MLRGNFLGVGGRDGRNGGVRMLKRDGSWKQQSQELGKAADQGHEKVRWQ